MCSHSEGVLHDKPLCRRAQAGDPDAQTEVFSGCDRLVRSRIDHVIGVGRWPANVSLPDAEQEARMALFRALLSWDGRRPLTTLAVTCIDRQLRRWRAQTFPTLHMSRAAYTAAHGHVAIPVSLDDQGDGESRPLGETVCDTSTWGSDPIAILEAAETARERRAVIAAHLPAAVQQAPAPCRTHAPRRPRVRVLEVHHAGSAWCSLRLGLGTDATAPRRSAPRKVGAAARAARSHAWLQLSLDLGPLAA